MSPEQERTPRTNEGLAEDVGTSEGIFTDDEELVKPCGVSYRTFSLRLLPCGRPAGHVDRFGRADSHYVNPLPGDVRPSSLEEILARHGWIEVIPGIWSAA